MEGLPFLLEGAPLRAVLKARWEDFRVEEVPATEPAGTGDHLWLEVEKRGLTTPTAAADLARALGVKPSSVGYAGLKDARAVARQWMSVEHVPAARALALDDARIRVLRAVPHPRKLRKGWHAGNRFVIRLRPPGTRFDQGLPVERPAHPGSGEPRLPDAAEVARRLEELARRGVPNFYGPQRFGTRGDTWRVGRALAREEWGEAAALIAGRPLRAGGTGVDAGSGIHPDSGDILLARELFDAGAYEKAAAAWPRGFAQCARLAAAMARTGGDARRSIPVVGKRMLRLYASAWQARLFNAVLAARMPHPDRVLAGDLAWKHDSEALFPVEDAAAEQQRAEALEISATGPLVGARLRVPTGEPGRIETAALAAAGYDDAQLASAAMAPLTGRRRPLRFPLADAAVDAGSDDGGAYLEVRFFLPPGCYATTVLWDVGKGGIVEPDSGG